MDLALLRCGSPGSIITLLVLAGWCGAQVNYKDEAAVRVVFIFLLFDLYAMLAHSELTLNAIVTPSTCFQLFII